MLREMGDGRVESNRKRGRTGERERERERTKSRSAEREDTRELYRWRESKEREKRREKHDTREEESEAYLSVAPSVPPIKPRSVLVRLRPVRHLLCAAVGRARRCWYREK